MPQSILIVDDHKVTALGYKSILENNDFQLHFSFHICTTLQEAYLVITDPDKKLLLTLFF
jgi:CheY-like chemotaxis protein